jgi:hypothetical protein
LKRLDRDLHVAMRYAIGRFMIGDSTNTGTSSPAQTGGA